MVVYEVKDSGSFSQRKTPKPIRRDISPTMPVHETKAIGNLLGRQYYGGQKKQRREPVELDPARMRDVKRLTEEINSRLEKKGAGIHLVLVLDNGGFVLDVYDCTDANVCRVVHNIIVRVGELQGLLASLQKESGIIFDQTF